MTRPERIARFLPSCLECVKASMPHAVACFYPQMARDLAGLEADAEIQREHRASRVAATLDGVDLTPEQAADLIWLNRRAA